MCEFCRGEEYLYYEEAHGTIAIVEIVKDMLVSDLYKDYAEIKINYCPMCGERLKQCI